MRDETGPAGIPGAAIRAASRLLVPVGIAEPLVVFVSHVALVRPVAGVAVSAGRGTGRAGLSPPHSHYSVAPSQAATS